MKHLILIFVTTALCLGEDLQEFNRPKERLVGANNIYPFTLPYVVALNISGNGNNLCGGALVSVNYVLTAANCTYQATSIEVVVGAYNITRNEATQQRLITSNFTIHPDWDSATGANDIALIALPQPVRTTSFIKTIPIATEDDTEDLVGKTAFLSGWGKTHSTSDQYSDILLRLDIEIIENYNSTCDEAFGDKIQDTNICANGYGPTNICIGDYGDPFVLNGNLIGLASFSHGNCNLGFPNVLTNVVKYRSWIATYSDAPIE